MGLACIFTLKPILPLCSHGQHKHSVDSRHRVVKRYITTRRAANDEFAFAVFHGSDNLRALGQDLDGLQNAPNTLGCRGWVELGKAFKETVEVI